VPGGQITGHADYGGLMPRPQPTTQPLVFLHGLGGSDPTHWQRLLAGLPDGGYDVLCHSLGSLLWLHHAARGGPGPAPARVMLVAPPSPSAPVPELTPWKPVPLDPDPVRTAAGGTILVCSDNDPHCPEGAALAYGRPLRIPVTVIPGAEHINVASGYGDWPPAEQWCIRPNLAFPL
jgi:predicted alpha/beta hydrolase family esterase